MPVFVVQVLINLLMCIPLNTYNILLLLHSYRYILYVQQRLRSCFKFN